MNSKAIAIGAVAVAVLCIVAYKFLPSIGMDGMQGMDHSMMTSTDDSPSTKAFQAAIVA